MKNAEMHGAGDVGSEEKSWATGRLRRELLLLLLLLVLLERVGFRRIEHRGLGDLVAN